HDRYFVDKLANKIVVVGDGAIEVYPGTYEQFLWSRQERAKNQASDTPSSAPSRTSGTPQGERKATAGRTDGSSGSPQSADPRSSGKLRPSPDDRRRRREGQARERRIADLESRIAEREQAIKELETQMADTGFYGDRTAAEA